MKIFASARIETGLLFSIECKKSKADRHGSRIAFRRRCNPQTTKENIMNTRSRFVHSRALLRATTAAALALGLCGGIVDRAQADEPGRHPHYLHALSDLRAARALLNRADERNVTEDERAAIRQLNRAIGDIKQASFYDGKLGDYAPPVDANLSHKDRLQKAVALLGNAHHDLTAYHEDDPLASDWRSRAVGDIDGAYKAAQRAVRDDYHDDHPRMAGAHPEYIKALSDLRMARELLSFADEGNVMADERQATNSINQAIKGAKRAAIDDGLDIFATPPADTNLPRHDRLRQAARLLHDTYNRLMRAPESDRAAQGVLYDTLFNLNRAIGYADKAIRDDRHDDMGSRL